MVATCVAARRPDQSEGGIPVFARWHVLGGLLGGTILGLVAIVTAAILSAILGRTAIAAVALAGLLLMVAYALNQLPGRFARFLSAPRQVPQAWHRALPVQLSAGLYGLVLGFGLGTRAPIPFPQSLFLVLIAQPSPALAVFAGAAYGVGRATAVVAGAVGRASVPRLHDLVDSTYAYMRAGAVAFATAGAAVVIIPHL